MNKEKFKKFLVSSSMGIMTLAMPFAFTACDTKTDPIKTDDEAYAMLRTYIDDYKVINSNNFQQTYVSQGRTQKVSFDFSQSNLSDSVISILVDDMQMENSFSYVDIGKEYFLDKNTNTGYIMNRSIDSKLDYEIDYFDVTKYENNNYYNYRIGDLKPVVSKVDEKFAKENYNYLEESLKEDSSEVYNVWQTFKDYETYDKYLEKKNDIASGLISEMSQMEVSSDDLVVNISLDYKNGDYIWQVNIKSDDAIIEVDETGSTKVLLETDFNIVFNTEGIVSSSAEMTVNQNAEMSSAMFAIFDMENNGHLTENDKVFMSSFVQQYFSVDYKAEIDNKDSVMKYFPIDDCLDIVDVIIYEKDAVTNNLNQIEQLKLYIGETFKIADLPIPQKPGYTLSYEDKLGNVIDNNTIISDDIEIVVCYERNSYAVNYMVGLYDENGGSLGFWFDIPTAYQTKSHNFGASFVLPYGTIDNVENGNLLPELIRDGYTFVGWTTKVSDIGIDDIYAPGSEFVMPSQNVDFYAVWQSNSGSYTI